MVTHDASVHHHQVRVYFQDTDAAGYVHHAAYLNFAERARIETLRAVDLSLRPGMFFAVRRCVLDYFGPAGLDDLLDIETRVSGFTRITLTMQQQIKRNGTLLVDIACMMVCMSIDNWKPRRMPSEIVDILQRYQITGQLFTPLSTSCS